MLPEQERRLLESVTALSEVIVRLEGRVKSLEMQNAIMKGLVSALVRREEAHREAAAAMLQAAKVLVALDEAEACDYCGLSADEDSDRDEQCRVCGRGADR